MESRLWIDDAPATERGRGRRAAALRAGRDARVRVRPRPRRPHEPVDPRPRRAGRDPRLGRGHPVVARRPLAARARGRPRLRPRRRADGDEDRGGGRRGAGSEGLPAGRRSGAGSTSSTPRRATTREVQPEGVNVFEFDWAGGKVAAVCTDEPSESAWYDAWIGLIDLDSRTVERVHTPEWQLQCPRHLARRARRVDRGLCLRPRRRHRHRARPRRRPARAGARRDVDRLRRRGDALVRGLARRAARCSAGSGSTARSRSSAAGDVLVGARFQPRVAPSADGIGVATIFESPTQPPEVVALRGRRAARAHVAERRARAGAAARRMADVRVGVLRRARDRGAARAPAGPRDGALPLVVVRPRRADGHVVVEFADGCLQLLVAEGYAVLLPNPRGSSGRGQEFARANLGDMGGGDLKDILAGVDALVARRDRRRRARRDHRRQLRRLHVVVGGDADRPLRAPRSRSPS